MKDEKFAATDQGITVGSEVVLIEKVELFEVGNKIISRPHYLRWCVVYWCWR